jgi:hypothetical protein
MFESIVRVPLAETAYSYHQQVWALVRKSKEDVRNFIFRVRTGRNSALIKIRSKEPLLPDAKAVDLPVQGGAYVFTVLLNIEPSDVPRRWIDESSVIAWLKPRLEAGGIKQGTSHVTFKPGIPMGKGKWQFRQIEVIGKAMIIDAEKAAVLMEKGIGKARGFGFGLIELENVYG